MAGVKMAASSVGTALAGVAVGVGPRAPLGVGAALTAAAVATALVERRLSSASAPAPSPELVRPAGRPTRWSTHAAITSTRANAPADEERHRGPPWTGCHRRFPTPA